MIPENSMSSRDRSKCFAISRTVSLSEIIQYFAVIFFDGFDISNIDMSISFVYGLFYSGIIYYETLTSDITGGPSGKGSLMLTRVYPIVFC